MFDCLVMGDSIAQGISWQLRECRAETKVGITSHGWWVTYSGSLSEDYATVVISLGTNDGNATGTLKQLMQIRKNVKANRVLWIMPTYKFSAARSAVQKVADAFGDGIIEIRHVSKDGIHPTSKGYRDLAQKAFD